MKTAGFDCQPFTSMRCVARAASRVLIPPGDDPWEELFDMLDGLILAGGGDVEPSLYGGSKHEEIYGVDTERDRSELALARRVAASELPTLGICRGHQLVNVALGGTLHEHLPDVVGDAVVHRLPPREPTEHSIMVDAKSRLAGILGESEFPASSWHHQAIREAAHGLVAGRPRLPTAPSKGASSKRIRGSSPCSGTPS